VGKISCDILGRQRTNDQYAKSSRDQEAWRNSGDPLRDVVTQTCAGHEALRDEKAAQGEEHINGEIAEIRLARGENRQWIIGIAILDQKEGMLEDDEGGQNKANGVKRVPIASLQAIIPCRWS